VFGTLEINPEKSGQKIFVYCALATTGPEYDRSNIAWANKVDRGTSDEGECLFRLHGRASPDMSGLAGYEKSFPERLKKSPAFRELAISSQARVHAVLPFQLARIDCFSRPRDSLKITVHPQRFLQAWTFGPYRNLLRQIVGPSDIVITKLPGVPHQEE